MKKFTKILSILCALALLASVISVGFVASAAEATMSYTDYDTFNAQTSYDAYGANHLASASVSAKATEIINGEATSAGSWTPGAGLTDNSPAAQQMIQVTWPSGTANGPTDSTSTNQYLDYTFALPSGVNNPEMVLLAFVQTGTSVNWNNTFFDCRHWAIYASDSAETLYTGEPIYYRQISGQAAPEYKVDISDLELKNVKYLGVRVYNFYFWGNTVLFSEIGLYGGKATFQGNPEPTSDNYATRFGDNWLTSSSYVSTESVDGVIGTPKSVIGSISVDNLWSTGRTMYQSNNGMSADNNEDGQTDTYFQTTFTLAAPVNNPETALIAWENSNSAPNSSVSEESHHYEIFASDKLDDLYTKSVYKHYTTSDAGREHVIDISSQNLKNVKYFGIRIYHRTATLWNGIMVITEIGLYGGNSILTDSATYTDDENNVYNYGANRLAGSSAVTTGVDNGAVWEISKGADVAVLTDGSVAARCQIQAAGWDNNYTFSKASESKYIQVTFTLNYAIKNPEKFLIAHDHASNESAPTVNQWYAIYASDTEADLYDSPIFVYKNASAKMVEQQLDLSGMNLGNVKYFGIRFYHTPTGVFALPSEIALYGGKSILTDSADYSDDENDAYAYGENRLFGSNVTTAGKFNGADATFSGESNLADMSTLTNNITTNRDQIQIADTWDNSYNFSKANENTYIEVTFELKKAVINPTKFLIAHDQPSMISNPTVNQWYEIYASEREEDLYSKSIFVYKNASAKMVEQQVDLSGMNLGTVKYFGIRFYHLPTGCFALPSEIALYGGTYAAASLNLSASVYNSNSGSNSNDIIYHVDASDFDGEITDMGIISGFKMNIDADANFANDYAAYLKSNGTASAKVSAPADLLGAEDLFFQVVNSGTHNGNDYSGYIVATIAYVTVIENGTPTTYYSNVITKSSMQISRNQAKAYKEAGYVVEGYESYQFATDGTIDIAKVREYVEACTAQDLSKKNSQ